MAPRLDMVEHLRRYPAATLDQCSRENARQELTQQLERCGIDDSEEEAQLRWALRQIDAAG